MSEPTAASTPVIPTHPAKTAALGKICFLVLSILCMLLLLWHSDTAISYMSRGLTLCAQTVIPSLFPFMILSELLVASGGGEVLGKLCEKPFKRLFGISGSGVCALLMGLICGFPIGAKTAVSLCRRGDLDTAELSRLLCFCNIPSSAFLMNAVGISLFGSRRFGLALYGICLLAAVLTAVLLRSLSPLSPSSIKRSAQPVFSSGIYIFTHAVTSSATAMLYVCAYVVFFSALIGTLGQLLTVLGAGQTAVAALFGFFELSGGVMQASAIPDLRVAQWLTALLCGWSGISVHLQILSLCGDLPNKQTVKIYPYLLSKLFQGILCALLCGILLYIAPSEWFAPMQCINTSTIFAQFPTKIVSFLNLALILSWFFLLARWFIHQKKATAKGRASK